MTCAISQRRLIHVFIALGLLLAIAPGQNIQGIALSQGSVIAGQSVTGTVSLNKAATAKGLKITLSSSSKDAQIPATVEIAAGALSANFTITTSRIDTTAKATIKGVDPAGKSSEATLTIAPPAVRLAELSLSPTSLEVSKSATATVTLSADAPAGGFPLSLSSTSAAVSFPSTVVVNAGAKTATFSVLAKPVTSTTSATIDATDENGYTASSKLTVELPPVRVASIKFATTTVTAANPATGTVNLSSAAPKGGFNVALSVAQSFATAPTSVTVKAGSKSATFTLVTSPITTTSVATVTALDAYGYSASGSVTINVPPIRLTGLTFSPSTVLGGNTTTGFITLSAPAPSAGFTVNLSTMQSAIQLPLTAQVSIGQSSAVFTVSTSAVTSNVIGTVIATDSNGYSAQANLTVTVNTNPGAISITPNYSYSPQRATVAAGTTVTWTNNPNGSMVHTVTPDLPTAGMDSGTKYPSGIPLGASFSWTVPANAKSGTAYYYHCAYHGVPGNGTSLGTGMVGVIIVK